MHRMFVYGTLKRGQPNHYLITGEQYGKAEYLGQGLTADNWPLVVATEYNVPFMLDAKGTGKRIYGEVYDINEDTLREFDRLEHHPVWYTRTLIKVKLELPQTDGDVPATGALKDEQTVDCVVYLLCDFKEKLLALPHKENYDNYEDPDKGYSKLYESVPGFMGLVKKL